MSRGRSYRPGPEEMALWRHATRDVDPLRPRPAADPPAPAPPPPKRPESKPPAAPARPKTAKPRPAAPPPTQPTLAPGETAGLDRRTAERLRQGRLSIDARLDLHGMTQAQAHGALAGFVERCHADGRRVVLVITGKGSPRISRPDDLPFATPGGILKARVPAWLNEPGLRSKVLAVHHARPQHGGDGALYVLLKRRR